MNPCLAILRTLDLFHFKMHTWVSKLSPFGSFCPSLFPFTSLWTRCTCLGALSWCQCRAGPRARLLDSTLILLLLNCSATIGWLLALCLCFSFLICKIGILIAAGLNEIRKHLGLYAQRKRTRVVLLLSVCDALHISAASAAAVWPCRQHRQVSCSSSLCLPSLSGTTSSVSTSTLPWGVLVSQDSVSSPLVQSPGYFTSPLLAFLPLCQNLYQSGVHILPVFLWATRIQLSNLIFLIWM